MKPLTHLSLLALITAALTLAGAAYAQSEAENAHAKRQSVGAKQTPSDSDNRICVKSDVPSRAFVAWTTGKIFSKSYFDTQLPTNKDTPGFDGVPRNCACLKSPKVYDDNWNVSFQKKGNVSDLQVKTSAMFDMGKAGQKKSVLVVFNSDATVIVLPNQGCDNAPLVVGK
jgi:hypothetical protein